VVKMRIQELLDRLERIRDGFLDASDRHMIEGMAEDISDLMFDINTFGVQEGEE
tara:strand:- start:4783 stop:4944 length:162 start_codon:yes stop_codon:yes gene_type:complete